MRVEGVGASRPSQRGSGSVPLECSALLALSGSFSRLSAESIFVLRELSHSALVCR